MYYQKCPHMLRLDDRELGWFVVGGMQANTVTIHCFSFNDPVNILIIIIQFNKLQQFPLPTGITLNLPQEKVRTEGIQNFYYYSRNIYRRNIRR